MATDHRARQPLSDAEHRGQLRRALIASTIGTTIEWYDFLLYSTVTGLVFAKLFFPASDPLIGTLQAYVIFYIGFIARPVGAAIFGHYGDRIGRKATLIATLVITGLATVAVGLVPTYDQIGIWAALIMIVLRFIQGVGVGGEWGGSVLMSMEWAKTNANRGFIASWPQFGGPAGIALANLAVLVFSWISGDQFLVWGWRIPFLLSIIMVAVGLYIRLGVLETPVFAEMVEKERLSSSPVLEVLKRQPKEVFLSAFVRMGEQGPGYVYIAFIFTYGTRVLGVSRDLLLSGMVTAAILGFLWVPVAGHLSDRIGRRRMYIMRRHLQRRVWVHLLRAAGYEIADPYLRRGRAVAAAGHDALRSAGGADRRVLRAAPALQRRGTRLSARLDRRRRPRAVHRHRAARRLWKRLLGGNVHRRLLRDQHRFGDLAGGSHQQGSRGGARGHLTRRGGYFGGGGGGTEAATRRRCQPSVPCW